MKVLLVGANGYGARFLEPLFDMHKNGKITFEGVVTRSDFPMQDVLKEAGVSAYKTLDAFYGCGRLHSVILPDSLYKINNRTFYGCNKLKNVV